MLPPTSPDPELEPDDPTPGDPEDSVPGDSDDSGLEGSGLEGSGDRVPGAPTLDERGVRMLEFEHRWWRDAGAKDQAIRDEFSLSPTQYHQLLNALLDDPAALERDPVLVNRLRRLRADRTRRY